MRLKKKTVCVCVGGGGGGGKEAEKYRGGGVCDLKKNRGGLGRHKIRGGYVIEKRGGLEM